MSLNELVDRDDRDAKDVIRGFTTLSSSSVTVDVVVVALFRQVSVILEQLLVVDEDEDDDDLTSTFDFAAAKGPGPKNLSRVDCDTDGVFALVSSLK